MRNSSCATSSPTEWKWRGIVLVGEWDTLYSRGLGRTLAAKLLHREAERHSEGGPSIYSNRDTWSRRPSFMHEYATDMDALYFDPSERASARNLVIVSPFGLSACDKLQGRIPPFRDSYQTGLFLTTLRALNLDAIGQVPFDLSPGAIPARVFEVGRSTAHDRSLDHDPGTAGVHPGPRVNYHGLWIIALVGLVAGASIIKGQPNGPGVTASDAWSNGCVCRDPCSLRHRVSLFTGSGRHAPQGWAPRRASRPCLAGFA